MLRIFRTVELLVYGSWLNMAEMEPSVLSRQCIDRRFESAEQMEATDQLQRDVLKGTRWLLLKRSENLNEDRSEPERLREVLRLNESLAIAYYLKEELQLLWEEPTKRAAGRFLDGWIAQAEASGIRVLKTFARTLARYRRGLLAWYDHPISTGPLEGTNNKIKTLKRQAYACSQPSAVTACK